MNFTDIGPTMEESHARDAFYYGPNPDARIIYSMHRDSDIGTRCNFQAFINALDPDNNHGYFAVERSSHWAVGWIDYLIITPDAPSSAIQQTLNLLAYLDDSYPVLDEDLLSEMEYEECAEIWANCYSPADRLDYLRRNAYPELSGDFRALRSAIQQGSWSDASRFLPCPSDLAYS